MRNVSVAFPMITGHQAKACRYRPGSLCGRFQRTTLSLCRPVLSCPACITQRATIVFYWTYERSQLTVRTNWKSVRVCGDADTLTQNKGKGLCSCVQHTRDNLYNHVLISAEFTLFPVCRLNACDFFKKTQSFAIPLQNSSAEHPHERNRSLCLQFNQI